MKNNIKILGAFGSKTFDTALTCILTDYDVLIDAGNILHAVDLDARNINHILLTHAHLDHIADIPFLIDIYFEARQKPLIIYGTKGTLSTLKEHILNWDIWPDFTEIPLTTSNKPAIKFQEIELDLEFTINQTTYKPIKTNHTSSSCGYVITKNNHATFFTADTYQSEIIWNEVNTNKQIKSIIIDVSFPSTLDKLAQESKHLTPKRLEEDKLKHLKRDDVKIFINHLKPIFIESIKDEIKTTYPKLFNGGQILNDGDILYLDEASIEPSLNKLQQDRNKINQLIDIGHSLTSEKNFHKLMEKILLTAKQISNADGGTLYLMSDDDTSLKFTVVQTDSLNIKMGGTEGEITWQDVQLYKEDGTQNHEQVAALCGITGKLININDVYDAKNFDFKGTKKFDVGTGYRTKSMLVIPMINHENRVIGVLQLLNKMNHNKEIIPFTKEDEKLILSISSQAAVSISNNRLISELEKLLMDFIKSIADAINEKSKYTGGHINRVAELSVLIANAINTEKKGKFKNINLNNDDLKQLDIAAWMHDIGKITTPEYIIDKATKLETIYDRIDFVISKFEILKRDKEIIYLKALACAKQEEKEKLKYNFEQEIAKINDDIKFIQTTNKGGEFMEDEKIHRLEKLASIPIVINKEQTTLLTKNELYNLSIKKGTLTNEERNIINHHVNMSYSMLNKLSFPQKLKRVPIIASSHHKTIYTDENGTHGGYGHKDIMDEPMSLEDRILAIADIFEAITASDRPYKDPNTLNQSLNILACMAKENHLDYDLVKYFIDNKIYEEYAKNNLHPSQLDEVSVKL
jgi:HD-GYP domain-containing protein (c-di-GMP phosphodiesterase class II)/phosphoribosyl 1,2-cyclic phosphodiesterase